MAKARNSICAFMHDSCLIEGYQSSSASRDGTLSNALHSIKVSSARAKGNMCLLPPHWVAGVSVTSTQDANGS